MKGLTMCLNLATEASEGNEISGGVVQFLIPKSLSKKDWLVCRACRLPQYLFMGCCSDPDCEPHTFRITGGCMHCGFTFDVNANPGAYDVEAGKAQISSVVYEGDVAFAEFEAELRMEALQQYAEVPDEAPGDGG